MDLDLIFKALANPTRRQILAWLKTPEQFLSVEECGDFHRGVCAGQIEKIGSSLTIDHVESFVCVTTSRINHCQ